ncbi:MAG: M64 family metallo-endopeptidase [Ignavibacteriales bacterium]|nr:M64 family metallo-endopeptidase [Ignavibacteriales bacterium]
MKILFELLCLMALFPILLLAQPIKFNNFFFDKTMRIDYFHVGNANSEIITVDKIYQQGIWAGSLNNLIDDFNNGKYYYKIYDKSSGTLIYSKGFDSYFGEYKTSDDGIKGIQRTYHESCLLPYPKDKIIFALEKRNKQNQLEEFFRQEIDPNSIGVLKDKIIDKSVKVFEAVKNGNPHTKVDIVILGEGYTAKEVNKFKNDLEKFSKIHFAQEPYKSLKKNFNIYGVLKPSEESGVDEPDHGSFKNTTLNCTFNSLGSERYLLTEDNKTMRDLAAHVPYDAIYIMVNHKRYGGGGIYNLYCTFTTDNQWHEYLFLHEFGHSFSGLADEYYTSDVAYNEFYPKGIEPVEPNITALLDPENLKWKNLATPGIEIPAKWEKAGYDSADYDYQKIRRELNNKIAEMKRGGGDKKAIAALEEKSERVSLERANEADAYLLKSKYWNKVGAFEGAGYASNGLYRPMLDCIMFSKGKKPFCKVCEQAIIKVIEHYTK